VIGGAAFLLAASSPRARAAMLGAAALAAVLLALAPGALAPAAARAALVAGAIAGIALLAQRRARPAPPTPLAVLARKPIAPGAGLALVDADGRRLLVGFGRDGVRLVADLGAAAERDRP
jgi:flagellar protein FliO/FliZ